MHLLFFFTPHAGLLPSYALKTHLFRDVHGVRRVSACRGGEQACMRASGHAVSVDGPPPRGSEGEQREGERLFTPQPTTSPSPGAFVAAPSAVAPCSPAPGCRCFSAALLRRRFLCSSLYAAWRMRLISMSSSIDGMSSMANFLLTRPWATAERVSTEFKSLMAVTVDTSLSKLFIFRKGHRLML
jgi:hypothetical protein